MWNICQAYDSHEISSLILSEKKKQKKNKQQQQQHNVICFCCDWPLKG